MLNKLYHKGAEIKSAFLNGVKVFGTSEVPVEPSGDMGLAKDYSGTGWYKATDTGTVFNKGVPKGETYVFSDSPKEYVSVHTKADAVLYGERAAVSNITDMEFLFNSASSFNQDISSWDVSNVTNMSSMARNATTFNQDISNWDVSNVTNMIYMFYGADVFNQDLSQWCVTRFTSEPNSFASGASAWTLPKPVWGTCPRGEDGSAPVTPEEPNTLMGLREDYSGTGWYKAIDTGTVFCKDVPEGETKVFEDGGLEYVSVYTKEDAKLYGERAATSNLTDMSKMFDSASAFNQDISSWDVSNVTDMNNMFSNTTSFNQDISNWDVSSVTSMRNMFNYATSFNSDISLWDVSNVTGMTGMFGWASSFNQDLSKWCVSLIPTNPTFFDISATSWTLPKPVWGTCPRGENASD